MSRRIQVIGAHSADFVWRAGGAIAKAVELGGEAEVVALSYGERGESGELWKHENQTIENVKKIRHAEAEAAAAELGASFKALDLGDYPLQIGAEELNLIAETIREFAPDVLVTHTDTDPFNPDHPVAYHAVDRARSLAAGAGVRERLQDGAAAAAVPVRAAPARALQLHADDVRRHHLGVREEAGRDGAHEGAGVPADLLRQRAEHRANHARRASGNQEVRYAEAFQRVIPQVVSEL